MSAPDGIESGYAQIGALRMYYEIAGAGAPVIVLHGGMASTAAMQPIVAPLARERRVIAVDLQAHGRTGDVDRPLRYEQFADDLAGLITHLGLAQVDAVGHSLGGGAALQLAIRHTALVRSLTLISTPVRNDAWFPEILAAQQQVGEATAEMMRGSPPHEQYCALAPNPDDWSALHVKLGELVRSRYDWSPAVAKLTLPIFFVAGDADSMPLTEFAAMFALAGGGLRDGGWDRSGVAAARLAVLPGATHYDIIEHPALPAMIADFLGA